MFVLLQFPFDQFTNFYNYASLQPCPTSIGIRARLGQGACFILFACWNSEHYRIWSNFLTVATYRKVQNLCFLFLQIPYNSNIFLEFSQNLFQSVEFLPVEIKPENNSAKNSLHYFLSSLSCRNCLALHKFQILILFYMI